MTRADFAVRMRETIARYYDSFFPTVMGNPYGIRRELVAVLLECLTEQGYGEGVEIFKEMWERLEAPANKGNPWG